MDNKYDVLNGLDEETKNIENNFIKRLSNQGKNNRLNSKSFRRPTLLNNTEVDLLNNKYVYKQKDLSYFNRFTGFYNKNFNLTSFKKEKEDSRSRSKSPQKIILPHQLRGNGIPKKINERINFLKNIFENKTFLKNYERCPKRKDSTFEELLSYILNFSRKTNILNAILLSFYYICQEIKYDYEFEDREEKYKTSQNAENVFESGLALSLGYTNIFEAILRKLDVRFIHIEGYCKYFPKNNNYMSSLNASKKFNKNNTSTFSNYNNNYSRTSQINNSSKTFYFNTEKDNILDYVNHCWNAFYYKGEWYLADVLLGSGSYEIEDIIKETNQFKSNDPKENFNLFYIFSWPEYFIYTHFPVEDNWQLTKKVMNFKQFLNKINLNYPAFYKGITRYDVELLSHKEIFIQITSKDNLVIKIRSKEYNIEGNLYNASNGAKISEVKHIFDQQTRIFSLEPIIPKSGDYLLRINLRDINSNDLSNRLLFDYRIKVTKNELFSYFKKYNTNKSFFQREEKEQIFPIIGNNMDNPGTYHRILTDYKKIFPSKNNKKICYDNEGIFLIEPRTSYLRKGVMTKFKTRIKGASHVSLLDGNKMINLKRVEEGVYEGQKIIETDNVSICCLRGKNVFTEVFKFKPKRNKYEYSQSQANSHNNRMTFKKLPNF